MFFQSFKRNNILYRASLQNLTQTYTNGVLGVKVWSTYKTVDCIFWKGSSSDGVFSDKIKADITAVCIFDPAQISEREMEDNSRVIISYPDITAYVNNAAGYNIGDSTIAIDSFTDTKLPIKKGDIITIAADVGGSVKTITSTTRTDFQTTGISFTPALVHAISDNDECVISPVVGKFSVITGDNIALQGKVIFVPLKEFK